MGLQLTGSCNSEIARKDTCALEDAKITCRLMNLFFVFLSLCFMVKLISQHRKLDALCLWTQCHLLDFIDYYRNINIDLKLDIHSCEKQSGERDGRNA